MNGVKHRTLETNGIRMHVAEQGAGPLVVLCHGFPESWYSWRHQLPALAEAGFHAVAPDMRGYGQTDRPEAIDQYTLLHLVGDMVGIHGIANYLLNTPWPKVVKGRSGLERLTKAPFGLDEYLALLDDATPAADRDLPKSSLDLERERRHSAVRILNPDYGTRCSTVLRITSARTIDFAERSFHPGGGIAGEVRYQLDMTPSVSS
jgi:hypothetical protein